MTFANAFSNLQSSALIIRLSRESNLLIPIQKITALLESCTSPAPKFPPTLLYNEGWLLRLALDWFSTHPVPDHPLTFSGNASWFSEALLPSPFLARYRGDHLAESWTHADGVVGHFQIGGKGKTGLSLLPDATQFVVLEAKLFSGLSASVKHALDFDQVARNVACIIEVLRLTNRRASDMAQLGFYILAPQAQIHKSIFAKQISHESISNKVNQRVQAFEGAKDQWYQTWFQPSLRSIKIGLISWEEIILTVKEIDSVSGAALEEFYQRALAFNAIKLGKPPNKGL